MTNPLTKSTYLEKLQQHKKEHWVNLLSSINVELDVMRNNMLFSGLESVAYNLNHKNGNIKFFELGKTYHKYTGYSEVQHLSIFATGFKTDVNWNSPQRRSDFYYLKSIVERLFKVNGIGNWKTAADESSELFEYSLKYLAGKKVLAEFGKVSSQFSRLFDIKQDVFFADIHWDNLLEEAQKVTVSYKEVSKYPSVRRDLALLLDKQVRFAEVRAIAEKVGKKLLREVDLFDIYEDEKIGKNNKSYAVSFIFKEDSRTLQDAEIDQVMQSLMDSYRKELNATIR
jgi:phenylalanyl-tRNA synthetase beta chain